MIKLYYKAENGQQVLFRVDDWEAVHRVANELTKAPIDLDHIYYKEGVEEGIFNLQSFEKC